MLPSVPKPLLVKREMTVTDTDIIATNEPEPEPKLDLGEVMTTLTKFSNSTNVKQLTKDINIERRQIKFVTKMKDVLDKLDKVKLEPAEKLEPLFLFCLQSATDYLHEHKQENVEDICADLLKPLCNGDVALTKQIIKMVRKRIKASTRWRRNKRKIYRFFFRW